MVSPELLRRYNCFSPVSEESLTAVAMIAEETFVLAETELFREGDPADELYIIESGEVRIEYTIGTGEVRTVDTLVAGDILGSSALVEPFRMTSIATTCMDTRLIRVRAKPLRKLCEADPLLGHRLMTQVVKLLSDRLEGARAQLAVVA
jgi:CRP-like cAMP-binding protein